MFQVTNEVELILELLVEEILFDQLGSEFKLPTSFANLSDGRILVLDFPVEVSFILTRYLLPNLVPQVLQIRKDIILSRLHFLHRA